MAEINIQDLQRDPSDFVRRIEAGESVLLVRGQQALATVEPLSVTSNQPRPFGLSKGDFSVPDDFDDPLPENILKEFYGQ